MKLDQVKIGMILTADGGFTCLANGEECIVKADDSGDLYVTCDDGRHYLRGQTSDDGEIVGLS